MFADIILNVTFSLYIAVLVVLAVAWRLEDRRGTLVKYAAIAGIVAGVFSIITNLIVLFSPELYTEGAFFVVLVVLALFVPVLVVVGGILTLVRRGPGVSCLAIGAGLWLINALIGLIGPSAGLLG